MENDLENEIKSETESEIEDEMEIAGCFRDMSYSLNS